MGWIRPDWVLSGFDLAQYTPRNFPHATVFDSGNMAHGLAPETKAGEERGKDPIVIPATGHPYPYPYLLCVIRRPRTVSSFPQFLHKTVQHFAHVHSLSYECRGVSLDDHPKVVTRLYVAFNL